MALRRVPRTCAYLLELGWRRRPADPLRAAELVNDYETWSDT